MKRKPRHAGIIRYYGMEIGDDGLDVGNALGRLFVRNSTTKGIMSNAADMRGSRT